MTALITMWTANPTTAELDPTSPAIMGSIPIIAIKIPKTTPPAMPAIVPRAIRSPTALSRPPTTPVLIPTATPSLSRFAGPGQMPGAHVGVCAAGGQRSVIPATQRVTPTAHGEGDSGAAGGSVHPPGNRHAVHPERFGGPGPGSRPASWPFGAPSRRPRDQSGSRVGRPGALRTAEERPQLPDGASG